MLVDSVEYDVHLVADVGTLCRAVADNLVLVNLHHAEKLLEYALTSAGKLTNK